MTRATRRAPHVEGDVEMRIVDPDRVAEVQRNPSDLLAVARHQRQPPAHRGDEISLARRRAVQDRDRRYREGRVPVLVLGVQERGIQRTQALHDVLRPPRARRPAKIVPLATFHK